MIRDSSVVSLLRELPDPNYVPGLSFFFRGRGEKKIAERRVCAGREFFQLFHGRMRLPGLPLGERRKNRR